MNWNELEDLERKADNRIWGTVAGVSFVPGYPNNLLQFAETIYKGEGSATIKRNPANKYDSNACEIWLFDKHFIGHVPKDIAAEIAPKMDAGKKYTIKITSLGFAKGDPSKPGAGFCIEEA
jgi:hypothetical protein